MGNNHRLVDRSRSPPDLVNSKSENIDCAWAQKCAEHSLSAVIIPNQLLHKLRFCEGLKKKQYQLQKYNKYYKNDYTNIVLKDIL